MMHRTNVLQRLPRPTQKSYRDAVAKIIKAIQDECDLSDAELADRLGCSGPTVANARNKRTDLSGVTLANIEREFGPAALDPFLALGGSRAVPMATACVAEPNAMLPLAAALHALIETQRTDSDGGSETTIAELVQRLPLLVDARTALDALIEIAESGREAPQLKAVRK